MITEKDLREAIAECEGERNPSSSTCIKLAAFYTIKEHLFPMEHEVSNTAGYSYAAAPAEYSGNSDFASRVKGKSIAEIMPVMDELMDAVMVLQPKLYASVMRKL